MMTRNELRNLAVPVGVGFGLGFLSREWLIMLAAIGLALLCVWVLKRWIA